MGTGNGVIISVPLAGPKESKSASEHIASVMILFYFQIFDFLLSFKAKLLQLKLIQIFATDILLMKKLEIEKTKPTFIISVFKVEY